MAILNVNKRASEIHFDNSKTTMTATTVQEAIEEIARNIGLGAGGSSTVETCTVYITTYSNVGCTFKYYDANNALQTAEVAGYSSDETFTVKTDTDIQVIAETPNIEFGDGLEHTPEYGDAGLVYTVHIDAGTDVFRITIQ